LGVETGEVLNQAYLKMIDISKSAIKKARKSFDFAPFRAHNRARTGDLLIKNQDP